eukprot:TRINITY_DN1532_c0_g1_i7.p1 TRINITY_DN1532_c0_g1~~TRINITY_DN1532_c0_g1_i7.p1  ORF type:complete len:201 (+),score=25.09 TRINITY_DN1532_c0_g1_i7:66-668(+)
MVNGIACCHSAAMMTPPEYVLATPPSSPSGSEDVTPVSSVGSVGFAESVEGLKDSVPCCEHNNWDNVRVSKKMMTLRCRVCQRQWRAPVDCVWNKLKCTEYTAEGTCSVACPKLHVNFRKQSLEARFKIHGVSVIDHVRVGRAQHDVRQKVETLREIANVTNNRAPSPTLSSTSSSGSSLTYTHDPYTWGPATVPAELCL